MGVNLCEAKAILNLRKNKSVGDEILCLGRPELFLSVRELSSLNAAFNLGIPESELLALSKERFAEPFLRHCGFTNIRSLDASAYEGAELIHDLNQPLPDNLKGATSFLYDGGTSEHVFNIAQVLHNITELVQIGGTILMANPANGQCGHGFYQFSPELFYRFFSANGFSNTAVYLVGQLAPMRWFHAVDPNNLRKRVQFMGSEPLQSLVVARKSTILPVMVIPQQSDYSVLQWDESLATTGAAHAAWNTPKARAKSFIRDHLVYPLFVMARHILGIGMPSFWNMQNFVAINPETTALLQK